jgi:hypothetical protein
VRTNLALTVAALGTISTLTGGFSSIASAQGARPPKATAAAARPAPAGNRLTFDRRTGLAETSVAALAAASSRGDKAELARWAERIGPARLGALLQASDRDVLHAALDGARVLEGGERLLMPVTRLLGNEDAKVAERAAATLADFLRADRLGKLAEWEVSSAEITAACSALARIADRAAAPLALRVAALEALAEGHAFCRVSIPLGTLSGDVSPEIRRAALLTPQIVRVQSVETIGELSRDPVPQVAGAAATVWCRHKLESLRKGAPGDEARQRLGRMRALVLMDNTPAEDTAEMLPCLGLSPNPEDKRAFETARKRRAVP